MVILLHSNTKKAQSFAWSYDHAKGTCLEEAYKTFSEEKRRAEQRCRDMMYKENGTDFRIMSANSFCFTCGWKNPDGTFRVETATHSYVIADKFAGIDH